MLLEDALRGVDLLRRLGVHRDEHAAALHLALVDLRLDLGDTEADEAARKKVLKPNTEWNSVEIVTKDGAITAYVNGEKVCESEAYELKEGPIGFQSEGAEIHFRNIRIKEMK